MYEATLRLRVKNPGLIVKCLEPDVKTGKDVKVCVEVSRGVITINIKSKKLSYLKAVINSYISLISMLKDLEEIGW